MSKNVPKVRFEKTSQREELSFNYAEPGATASRITVKPRRSIGMRRGDTGCYAMRHIATRVASWSNEPSETKEAERNTLGCLAYQWRSGPKTKEITEQAP